jgi:hypothetical protein
MIIIEEAKIDIFEYLVDEIFKGENENENRKVLVSLNYNDNIEYLAEKLERYSPIIITGKSTPANKRQFLVDKFNEDPKSKLVIANVNVICESYNMHDKVGNSPRFVLASPNYHCSKLHQLSRRCYRDGVKSDVTQRLIYGVEGEVEKSILDVLQRKSEIMGDTLPEQKDTGTLFPGDYLAEYL